MRAFQDGGFKSFETQENVNSASQNPSPQSRMNARTGFTLIELLISAAIITIISSIVLVRFNTFDGTVLLKSLAYEVALGVREAQIYSVSVIGTQGDGNFRYPYGVSFTQGGTGYTFFRYRGSATPQNDPANRDVIRAVSFANSMKVFDVCVTVGANEYCRAQGMTRLDISFRRPEFGAIFYTMGGPVGTISSGKIKVCSTRNSGNVWVVNVSLLGQISVTKDATGGTCT